MKEKKLLEKQLYTTIIFIISLFLSLSLTYDDYLKLDKKRLYSDTFSRKLGITNRLLVVILSFSYLYINYKSKEISNNKTKYNDYQIIASELSTIAAIIVLYVVIANNKYTITNIQNPIL